MTAVGTWLKDLLPKVKPLSSGLESRLYVGRRHGFFADRVADPASDAILSMQFFDGWSTSAGCDGFIQRPSPHWKVISTGVRLQFKDFTRFMGFDEVEVPLFGLILRNS